jgi:hypothetical protein
VFLLPIVNEVRPAQININTRKNTKRLDHIGGGKPGPGRKPGIRTRPKRAAQGREIVRRDYPDRDHPKLLEHVVDLPANAAATAVRKSPADSGAGGDDSSPPIRFSDLLDTTE